MKRRHWKTSPQLHLTVPLEQSSGCSAMWRRRVCSVVFYVNPHSTSLAVTTGCLQAPFGSPNPGTHQQHAPTMPMSFKKHILEGTLGSQQLVTTQLLAWKKLALWLKNAIQTNFPGHCLNELTAQDVWNCKIKQGNWSKIERIKFHDFRSMPTINKLDISWS